MAVEPVCRQTTLLLHGYLDGELDAARAAEFEQHLVQCHDCANQYAAQRSLRTALRGSNLYAKASPALARRIRSDIREATEKPSLLASIPSWRWLAAAASMALVLFAFWRFVPPFRGASAEQALATEIVDSHVRSMLPGHLTDVASTDQHTVKPWFDGKLDFAPPVRDFSGAGYPLIGGRLDVLNGRTVAALVYERRKHFINLYVWPSQGSDSAERSISRQGFNLVYWSRNGMSFWAVSDVAREDLEEFAQMLEH
ncbi:MAG TPA: anti-sigma factor [Candidatus Limnocylindria bacterium]|nr:anti-sigma factor [Candidatus Limnocylindria bacterium]